MTPLIAGNWKMNGHRADVARLAGALSDKARSEGALSCTAVLCPPATLVAPVADAVAGSGIEVGGQDCHTEPQGAFTGSVSAAMLRDLGCAYVIVGHSERRTGLGETDALVASKAAAALSAGLTPIVCVGETLAQRDAGEAVPVVRSQVSGSLPDHSGRVVLAYEPVWAIGTGRTPTGDDIAEIHGAIRALVTDLRADADDIAILYGGSAKAANASELLNVSNVGGLLVGGASLEADEFWEIIQAGNAAA